MDKNLFDEYLLNLIQYYNFRNELSIIKNKIEIKTTTIFGNIITAKNSLKRTYEGILLRWVLLKNNLNPSLGKKKILESEIENALSLIMIDSRDLANIENKFNYIKNIHLSELDKKLKKYKNSELKTVLKVIKDSKNQLFKGQKVNHYVEGHSEIILCGLKAYKEYKLANDLIYKINQRFLIETEYCNKALFALKDIDSELQNVLEKINKTENLIFERRFYEYNKSVDAFGSLNMRHVRDKTKKEEKELIKNLTEKYFKNE